MDRPGSVEVPTTLARAVCGWTTSIGADVSRAQTARLAQLGLAQVRPAPAIPALASAVYDVFLTTLTICPPTIAFFKTGQVDRLTGRYAVISDHLGTYSACPRASGVLGA
jgi:hypothetical protein